MAKPQNKQPKKPATSSRRNVAPAPSAAPEIVDPRWLLKMLGILLVLALLCGYFTLGLLFYLGSWQLVLHPTRNANGGTALQSEKVRFAPDGSGKPQISGEWIAAPAGSARSSYAVLYLHGADGQLYAADGTQIAMLRDAGLNVLAFDYRGYGASAERPHPSDDRMVEDAVSAWQYITGLRHIAPDHVLVFGSGIGASVGSQMLVNYGPGAAFIAYNADPEVLDRVHRDPRSHLFPLGLVFHDTFSLASLQHLSTPKLLYTVGPLNSARTAVYRSAADPKTTVEVSTHDAATEKAALSRFLDSLLPSSPAPLPLTAH